MPGFSSIKDYLQSYSAYNQFSTTLNSTINASDTIVVLSTVTGLPPKGVITITNEHVFYTGITGLTLTGCERGFDNSVATAHSIGESIEQRINSYIFNMSMSAIDNIPDVDFVNITTYQLSSDSFIPTDANVTIGLSAQTGATDDCVNISNTNVNDGEILIIKSLNSITYKTTGNLGLTADIITTTGDVVAFYRDGSGFRKMFLSIGGGGAGTISNLNGLTGGTQTFSTGTTGADFSISSVGSEHKFSIPDAAYAVRGVVTTGNQTFAGVKTYQVNDIRVTSTDILKLSNTAVADGTNQIQYSPRLGLSGAVWSGGATRPLAGSIELRGVTANIGSTGSAIVISASYNGGAYNPKFLLVSPSGHNSFLLVGGILNRTSIYSNWDSQSNSYIEINTGVATSTSDNYGGLVLSTTQNGTAHIVGAVAFANTTLGTAEKRLGNISSFTDGATNTGKLIFATANAGTVVDRMLISGAGYVGINKTASLVAQLDVVNATNSQNAVRIKGAASQSVGGLNVIDSADVVLFQTNSTGGIFSSFANQSVSVERINNIFTGNTLTSTLDLSIQRFTSFETPIISLATSKTITNLINVNIEAPSNIGLGTITNAYGLKVNAKSRFEDNLYVNGQIEFDGTTFDLIMPTGQATGGANITVIDNLADSFSFQEATNKYLTFCTTNSAESVDLGFKLKRSTQSAITAFATGGQASATLLTKELCLVATCATAGDSVKLPVAVAGYTVIVNNAGAAALAVFPNTGGTINGGSTDASITIPVNGTIQFVAISTTAWKTQALRVNGNLELTNTTGNNFLTVPDNLADAFSIKEGANSYLTLVTTNSSEEVQVKQRLSIKTGDAFVTKAYSSGTITVNTTAIGNITTGEDDLITYTLPAGILAKDGDFIEIIVGGTTAANANSKRIKLKFGATTYLDTTGILANAENWSARVFIIRTGAATQKIVGEFIGGLLFTQIPIYSTAAETLSGTVVIKTTGEATATDDIKQEALIVNWGNKG